MRVNLVNQKSKKISFNIYLVSITLLIAVVLGGITLNYIHLKKQINSLEHSKNNIEQRLNTLEKQKKEYINLKQKLEEFSDESQSPTKRSFFWDDLLTILAKSIPEQSMINQLSVDQYNLYLSGQAANNHQISKFIVNLNQHELIKEVKLQQVIKKDDLGYSLKVKINEGKKEGE